MKNSTKVWFYSEENKARSQKPGTQQSDYKKLRGLLRRPEIIIPGETREWKRIIKEIIKVEHLKMKDTSFHIESPIPSDGKMDKNRLIQRHTDMTS